MNTAVFYDALVQSGIDFFCGVPDSLLKDFCAYVTDHTDRNHNIITANEGNAIGLACGRYLATQTPALVYMQNSGLGNCVNPLLSLVDEDVYRIPLLMLIGWRGEPGTKDEPQHVKQGKVTNKLLDAMGIEHALLPNVEEQAISLLRRAVQYMKAERKPFALSVRKGTFDKYSLVCTTSNAFTLSREKAIIQIAQHLKPEDIVVSTTGQISRELYEYRESNGQSHKTDFLTVGSMGHASSIAMGIAIENPTKTVFCIDGDGACLMHLGVMPVLASRQLKNLRHIVLNNQSHDSVGSQPTVADWINFPKLAQSVGYEQGTSVSSARELEQILPSFIQDDKFSLLEIQVRCGARKDLGRPKESPQENKAAFMDFLSENKTTMFPGAISELNKILEREKAHRILIFTGKASFLKIESLFQKILNQYECVCFNNFSNNPHEEEVQESLRILGNKFDTIIAVGGGSVIDFAKTYRYEICGPRFEKGYLRLIAIPTTAGTGAESTRFAVVYRNGIKQSVEARSILPDMAICDSTLVEDVPRYLRACTGMDAFCQAIESYWSCGSTAESRKNSYRAIEFCQQFLESYVLLPDSLNSEKMMAAANFSGKAINLAKTTAAHAMSYFLTYRYQIPHGHAVALGIGRLMELNLQVTSENVVDPRGVDFVMARMQELCKLLEIDHPADYFDRLMDNLGLSGNLSHWGIESTDEIIASVNMERLQNNPRRLSTKDLEKLYKL